MADAQRVAGELPSEGHLDRTAAPRGRALASLSLTTLGVVYGDIGTSPLYAVREAFLEAHDVAVTKTNILGVLSLVFWSLILVISIKYLAFILRADSRGEGGILVLTSLITPMVAPLKGRRWTLIALGLFGTALLYGDGMITPAISVLSAVEGLVVATPIFSPYILLITVAILVTLFAIQSRGTAAVGLLFGPVTLLWFGTLAGLGIPWIAREPSVLEALLPTHALRFFVDNGFRGFLVLGSVFLVVTGGEALYADMGHFGKRPIRLAWFCVVLPALLLNYLGQGALLIHAPDAISNPFYNMVPAWALYPVTAIATAAAVIASQALISGAFSLTMQAVRLGYSPRLRIEHTSARHMGQIYIPATNWVLMISCVALVLGFGSSTRLAAAYGVAVTTTTLITSLLFYVVARERWKWPLVAAVPVVGMFIAVDLAFWTANLPKVPHGGWFPLVIGAVAFTLLSTWKTGRRILAERMAVCTPPLDEFLHRPQLASSLRVPGTAVFMHSNPTRTPPALIYNLEHNKVLHERVVLLSVHTDEVPWVAESDRAKVEERGQGIFQVTLHFGFMEQVNVPKALSQLSHEDLKLGDPSELSYFLGRETMIGTKQPGMAAWRERLFRVMSRNAGTASAYFYLPSDRVVELGSQVEL